MKENLTSAEKPKKVPPVGPSTESYTEESSTLGAVPRGLVAGLVGTAAMSLAHKAEMTAVGHKSSASPADAVCLLLGFETRTQAQERHLAREAHWAYGTTWGLAQSLLSRMPEPQRSFLSFPAVWSAGAVLLTAVKLAPPSTRWSTKMLLTDLGHHAVYTVAASLTFHTPGRIARRG